MTISFMGTKVQHLKQYAPIPQMLRDMRQELGLSQRDFGKIIGRGQTFIQYCETGSRRVDFSEFVAWSIACGCDPQKALAEYLSHAHPKDEAGKVAWEAAGISEDGGAAVTPPAGPKGRKKKTDPAADHRQLTDFLIQCLATLEPKARQKALETLPEAQRSELAKQLMATLKK